ncbi:BCCT family transporter [Saccharomonospora sp.]|uniref:BCCT family transporter n=1 Tax=Saccharomonospora sp. TaxID=33913 RepID=UPI0026356228|nr:BCCT family transporter [Saccharomonospora sp.]
MAGHSDEEGERSRSASESPDLEETANLPEDTGARTAGEPERAPESVAERGGHRPAQTDHVVFGVAAIIALAIVAWGIVSPGSLATVADTLLNDAVIPYGGWAFVLTASGFVLFAIAVAVSRYGRIPLGRDDERPEFRTVSWIAMMFSAGMGIGLMFFGVYEPVAHFVEPPPGTAPPNSDEAVHTAMATTLFHWTLHPWAIYSVVGLAIAYSAFRKGRSQLISAVFEPLIGKRRSEGSLGKAIDIMAIFATLFGSAASLGLGALQVGGGLSAVGWADRPGTGVLVAIIAVLTVAFVASAVSGIARGIQWLSNINMVLAALLAVFVLVVGPTVLILNMVPGALGDYLHDLSAMAGRTGVTGGDEMRQWLADWTVFYWAWWISWAPFVGMFIARISRGRTIREFVIGVIAVPSVVGLVWFSIFGGAAIQYQRSGVDIAGAGGEEAATFTLLENLPLFLPIAIIVMILVSIFFVSGADAASVVMGTLSQRGSAGPRRKIVIFWGAVMGAVAAVMLLVGGDDALNGLQNLTILVSVPFVLVMIALCVSLYRDLRHDPLVVSEDEVMQSLRKLHAERKAERKAERARVRRHLRKR